MPEQPPRDELAQLPNDLGAVLLALHRQATAQEVELGEGQRKPFRDWLIGCAKYLNDPAVGNPESTSGMPLAKLAQSGARRIGQPSLDLDHVDESQLRTLARYGELPLYMALTDPRQQPNPYDRPPVLSHPDVVLMVLKGLGVVDPNLRANATVDQARAYWGENVFSALQEGVAGWDRLKEKSGLVKPNGMFESDGSPRVLGYGDPGTFYLEYPTQIVGDEPTMKEAPHGPLAPVLVRAYYHNPQAGSDEVVTVPYIAAVVPGHMALESRSNPSPDLRQLANAKTPPWPPGGVSWQQATRGRA